MSRRDTALLEAIIDQLQHAYDNDPDVLLSGWGNWRGPADLIWARLYGFDDQLDWEGEIRDPRPEILRPTHQRLRASNYTPDLDQTMPTIKVATYRQVNWIRTTKLDPPYACDLGLTPSHPDCTATVALLIYRRVES